MVSTFFKVRGNGILMNSKCPPRARNPKLCIVELNRTNSMQEKWPVNITLLCGDIKFRVAKILKNIWKLPLDRDSLFLRKIKMVKHRIQYGVGQGLTNYSPQAKLLAFLQHGHYLSLLALETQGTVSHSPSPTPASSANTELASAQGQHRLPPECWDLTISIKWWNLCPGGTSPPGPTPQAIFSSAQHSSRVPSLPSMEQPIPGKQREAAGVFSRAL